MSLTRTALRLATIEALRPSALTTGPWPTLGGKYIFDSRLDPFDDLGETEKRPAAVVYTDEDTGEPAQKAGGPPFKRDVDLMIEISVIAHVTDDGVAFDPGIPFTDGELESSLDTFEMQVHWALFYGDTGRLWRDLTGSRAVHRHSMPKRTSEESARLATRSLHLKVTIPDDEFDPAPLTAPSGLDRLPEPIKTVFAALVAGGYGAKLGIGLAAAAPVMPTRVPLNGVTFKSQVCSPPAPLDGAKTQIMSSADNLQD